MLKTCGNDIIIYCIGISIFVPQCPRENGDIGGLSPTQKGEDPNNLRRKVKWKKLKLKML
jgi:hypothetical protein